MSTRTHDLKCWPEPFQAILDGRKRHEIRVDDRGYAVGDVLHLREWDPAPFSANVPRPNGYTSRNLKASVTYLTHGGQWGLPSNLCVMSIEALP